MTQKEWVLAGASAVISLLIAEAGVRRFMPEPARVNPQAIKKAIEVNHAAMRSLHRADPQIGWVLSSDPVQFRHKLVDDSGALQYDVVYSVSGGRRVTSEHPPEGPAVITAGCSFTFGHGLNDRDTWPWQLQEKLPQYHVINSATMAYGTDQALMAAERQVQACPEHAAAVVLGFADFQIERTRSPQGWLVHVYPFSKPLFRERGGEAEYQRQVRFWSAGILSDHSDLIAHALNTSANLAYGIPSHEQARELTASVISTYAARFQKLGTRLAVVVLPYIGDQSPQARGDREFVVRRLKQERVPVFVADFPRGADGGIEGRDFLVSRIDRHPNRRYNSLVAGQVESFLRAEDILR